MLLIFFVDELNKRQMDVSGVIVNQRHFVKKMLMNMSERITFKGVSQEGIQEQAAHSLFSRLRDAHQRLTLLLSKKNSWKTVFLKV